MNNPSPFIPSSHVPEKISGTLQASAVPQFVRNRHVANQSGTSPRPHITIETNLSKKFSRRDVMSLIKDAEKIVIALDLVAGLWTNMSLKNDIRDISGSLINYLKVIVSRDADISETCDTYEMSLNGWGIGSCQNLSETSIDLSDTAHDVLKPLRHELSRMAQITECLLSYLSTLRQYRYVSEMNFTVLETHITKLADACEVIYEYHVTRIRDIREQSIVPENHSVHEPVTTADHHIDISTIFAQVPEPVIEKSVEPMSDNQRTSQPPVAPVILDTVVKSSETLSDRQRHIRDIIRDKHDVSVNDIAGLFPDMSKKTLQRDLNVLIGSGMISRTGEKRWAIYKVI